MALKSQGTQARIAAFILAGGLSSRMGRDKSRLPLGSRTMLGHVRQAAAAISLPARIIRKDAVPRCGPLGGIITAFLRTKADAVLFLACDMPLLRAESLRRLLRKSGGGRKAVFSESEGGPGFPFVLPRSAVDVIERQHRAGNYSLRDLASRLGASRVPIPATQASNVNDPKDLKAARSKL